MASSKLEERLAEALRIVGQDASGRWGYSEPIREFHPFWCCEHSKSIHVQRRFIPECAGCLYECGGEVAGCNCNHEYRRDRNFRVDFAYPQHKVAIECEGVTYAAAGRHQTGAGFSKDLEKYTALELAGWRVVRVGTRQITSGEALTLIEKALKERSLETVEAKE